MVTTEAQRRANVKLGITLAVLAVLFGVGFWAKVAFFGL